MNKKGFTLVELLATIGILVLMSVVIGTNIVSILNSTKEENKKNDKAVIEKAACVYVDSNACSNCERKTSVTVQELIISGLISEEEYKDQSSKTVAITRTNNEKICTYNK